MAIFLYLNVNNTTNNLDFRLCLSENVHKFETFGHKHDKLEIDMKSFPLIDLWVSVLKMFGMCCPLAGIICLYITTSFNVNPVE